MKQYFQNKSLLPYNTIGVDVTAAHFFVFEEVQDLTQILVEYDYLIAQNKKVTVLGQGSNILFMNDFDGVILKNEINSIDLIHESEEFVHLKVGGGFIWNDLVQYSIKSNWSGLEHLILIPGTVGAAPVQNIGAYGVEVAEFIEAIDFYSFEKKQVISIKHSDCAFGYRDSVFKKELRNKGVICFVTFKLNKKHRLRLNYSIIKDELNKNNIQYPTIQDIAWVITNIRNSKLPNPKILGNAGSFFKNPVIDSIHFQQIVQTNPDIPFHATDNMYKIPAGWLIEKAGWKGYRNNQVGCYEKQALILVNYGNATGLEILNLADDIAASVFELFGIRLEKEVNLIY